MIPFAGILGVVLGRRRISRFILTPTLIFNTKNKSIRKNWNDINRDVLMIYHYVSMISRWKSWAGAIKTNPSTQSRQKKTCPKKPGHHGPLRFDGGRAKIKRVGVAEEFMDQRHVAAWNFVYFCESPKLFKHVLSATFHTQKTKGSGNF